MGPMSPIRPMNRLQIHLSTAIILMLVAGGFLWANVTYSKNSLTLTDDEPTTVTVRNSFAKDPDKLGSIQNFGKGWPFFVSYRKDVLYRGDFQACSEVKERLSLEFFAAAAINFFVALAVLFLTCAICERWIGRARPIR